MARARPTRTRSAAATAATKTPSRRRTSKTKGRAKGGAVQASTSGQVTGPGFKGAGTGRRFLGFPQARLGPTAALVYHAATLRARARQLLRDDPYVWKAIRSIVANQIGTGAAPEPTVEDDTLAAAIRKAWERWVDECDADGGTDFYGLWKLVVTERLVAGESLGRFRFRRPADGLSVPLQLQIFEAEHLPLDRNEDLGQRGDIRAGIERDPIGRRRAYHLYRDHPDDGYLTHSSRPGELVRVPAEEILHVYDRARAGQLRGEPRLARVLLTAHDLGQFRDGTLVRQKIGSAITGVVQRTNPDLLPSVVEHDTTVPASGDVEPTIEVGSLYDLAVGEEIKWLDPPDIGADYQPFVKLGLRELSAGTGAPYEHTTGDYEGVTYSSVRSAVLQLIRECEQDLYTIDIPQFATPTWRLWFREAVMAGAIQDDQGQALIDRTAFRADPHRFWGVRWPGIKHDWVDPLKDAQGLILLHKAGYISGDAIVRMMGENPDEVDREEARRIARRTRLGLPTTTDGTMTPLATPSDDPAEQQPMRRSTRAA